MSISKTITATSGGLTWFIFALAIVIPYSAYYAWSAYRDSREPLPVYAYNGAQDEATDHRIPAFSFSDQNGQTVTEASLDNRITVVDYFFSHCPSICPKMTANLRGLQQELSEVPEFQILSFTVDPVRDSAARLEKFAQRFGADARNWHFLTGAKPELYRLARKGFLITAQDGTGDEDDFIHSEKFVLVDGQSRIRGFYDGTDAEQVQRLKKDILKLRQEQR